MNKFERTLDRVCVRLKLNPSNWLPHIKPDGVYEMGTSYGDSESMLDGEGNLREGTPVPMECDSIYSVFWNICYTRRKNADENYFPKAKKSKWESLWGFLSDVELGVYDTANWVPVGEWESLSR